MAAKWFNSLDTNSTHNYCLGTYNLPYIIFSKKCKVGMVLCYQNCSDLLWEKIVLVIEKNFRSSRLKAKNLQKFWDHLNNLFILWVSWFKNKSFWQRFTCKSWRWHCQSIHLCIYQIYLHSGSAENSKLNQIFSS